MILAIEEVITATLKAPTKVILATKADLGHFKSYLSHHKSDRDHQEVITAPYYLSHHKRDVFAYFLFWTCMSEIRNREFRLYI